MVCQLHERRVVNFLDLSSRPVLSGCRGIHGSLEDISGLGKWAASDCVGKSIVYDGAERAKGSIGELLKRPECISRRHCECD